MKLTDRGNTYKALTPVQPGIDSTDRLKIKLTYRGHTYSAKPRSVMVSEAVEVGRKTVTLIYRGKTYDRKLPLPKLDQQPYAINWRYQTPAEV